MRTLGADRGVMFSSALFPGLAPITITGCADGPWWLSGGAGNGFVLHVHRMGTGHGLRALCMKGNALYRSGWRDSRRW